MTNPAGAPRGSYVAAGPQNWVALAYGGDVFDAENPFKPAQTAYEEAVRMFKDTMTKDPAKRQLADSLLATCTFGEVVDVVLQAKRRYEDAARKSKTREGLVAFSQRLMYYGNIMDVLVQQHPEYVCLAWGAMKLIFGAIIEHETTGLTIITALCDISDSLPLVDITLALYPTATMTHAVSMLYAHILRFLVRALGHYEEGRLKRAIHSVTRPAALYYRDLVESIRRDAEAVRKNAATSSQAEIRAVHDGLGELRNQWDNERIEAKVEHTNVQTRFNTLESLFAQLRQTIEFQHAVQASAQLQIRSVLSDMELGQALSMISSQCSIDHKSVFQSAAQVGTFRLKTRPNVAAFWASPKLQQWENVDTPSTILINSTFRQGLDIRSCCTAVIKQLLEKRTAVFWILVSKDRKYPLLEILRSLVLQALSLDYSQYTESRMSFQLRKYVDAHLEDDYLNMLGDLLQKLKRVYIIVNSEAMDRDTAGQCRAFLQRLSKTLSEHGSHTLLKIIISSLGLGISKQDAADIVLDFSVNAGRANKKKAKREAQRHRSHYSSKWAT